MTYRPTEFEVENLTGISLEIRLNRECPQDEGGNVWFEISQDSASVVVSLSALENLLDAAKELFDWHRATFKGEEKPPSPAARGN